MSRELAIVHTKPKFDATSSPADPTMGILDQLWNQLVETHDMLIAPVGVEFCDENISEEDSHGSLYYGI